jgi:hypothetical protein
MVAELDYMDGGSKGLDYLMGVDRKGYADGSNYEFIKTLPKSLSDAINKFGFEAVIGKTVESGGGERTRRIYTRKIHTIL